MFRILCLVCIFKASSRATYTNTNVEDSPPIWILIQAGPALLVRLNEAEHRSDFPSNSSDAYKSTNGQNVFSFQRLINYITGQLSKWAKNHALAITIPTNFGARLVIQDGVNVVDSSNFEDTLTKGKLRGKKWAWAYMIPFMGLVKFFLLKAFLVPIFMATMIIKKFALMAFFYIPAWFATLKVCKKSSVVHHHHKSSYNYDDFAPSDFEPSGYQYTGYDKSWSNVHGKSYFP